MAVNISTKRIQIDKANTTIVLVVSIAAFISIFSLFACRSLLAKRSFQSRVITQKQKAANGLEADIKATNSLVASYKTFVSSPSNIIGGNSQGSGPNDGDNGKIILDALPSSYDFPALTTSIEKLLKQGNYKIIGISAIDQSLNQKTAVASPNPTPVVMPFEINVESSYADAQALIIKFEHSIRPFQIQTLDLKGSNADIKMDINEQTYYLPQKNLNIKTKVIK